MPFTPKNIQYPGPQDGPPFEQWFQLLAENADAMPGVTAMTAATRNGLTGAARWTGRTIVNLTSGWLEWWNGAAWQRVGIEDHQALTGRGDVSAHTQYLLGTDFQAHLQATDPHPVYVPDSLYGGKGWIVVGQSQNNPSGLAPGANGTALVADSTVAAGARWDYPQFVGAKVSLAAQRTVNTGGSGGVISWTTESLDTHNIHPDGGGHFDVPAGFTGRWRVEANIVWVAENSGWRRVEILRNGATQATVRENATNSARTEQYVSVNSLGSGGDFFQIQCSVDNASVGSVDLAVESWAACQFLGRG